MNLTLHLLEAEGSLSAWRDTLRLQTIDIGRRIAARVPADLCRHPVDILVQNFPEGTIPEMAMGGSCFRRGLVTISLAPDNPAFEAHVAGGVFQQMLAHELHHAMRWNACGYGETLGEAITSEGLADAFAEMLTGLAPPPWTAALDHEQLPGILAQANTELENPYYDHAEWFFGAGAVPRWAGYTLGYRLARLCHERDPDQVRSGFIDMPASAVLSGWPLLASIENA
jgi:hypothetical protein